MGHRQGTLADHVRVGQQFLFAPLRELVITGEGSNEPPIRGQDLHAVVLPVGDVNLAILVHSHAAGAVELANAAPGLPEAGQPLAHRA